MVVNQLSAAAATTSTGGSSTSAQAAAALMRFGGINAPQKQDKAGEDPIRDEDGLLNVETAETMLKWHAEATGRCVELSPSSDVYVRSSLRGGSVDSVDQRQEHLRFTPSLIGSHRHRVCGGRYRDVRVFEFSHA